MGLQLSLHRHSISEHIVQKGRKMVAAYAQLEIETRDKATSTTRIRPVMLSIDINMNCTNQLALLGSLRATICSAVPDGSMVRYMLYRFPCWIARPLRPARHRFRYGTSPRRSPTRRVDPVSSRLMRSALRFRLIR